MKKSELVVKLRESIVDKTNKYGYVDITIQAISEVLSDLELLIPIAYEAEEIKEEVKNEDNI